VESRKRGPPRIILAPPRSGRGSIYPAIPKRVAYPEVEVVVGNWRLFNHYRDHQINKSACSHSSCFYFPFSIFVFLVSRFHLFRRRWIRYPRRPGILFFPRPRPHRCPCPPGLTPWDRSAAPRPMERYTDQGDPRGRSLASQFNRGEGGVHTLYGYVRASDLFFQPRDLLSRMSA